MPSDALGEDPRIEELFSVPPEEFVKTRAAVVKELKERGDKDRAAHVAALRRPSGPVWAINQLARKHPGEIERYLEIQSSLGGVADATELNQLAAERRRVVGRLTQLGGKILGDAGHGASPQVLQRIGSTLLAADDPEEQEAIRAARLQEELTVSGFGGMSFDAAEDEEADADDERRRLQERAETLEAEAREASERAERSSEEAARLLAEAEATASAAREAREEAERLSKEAKTARSRLKRI